MLLHDLDRVGSWLEQFEIPDKYLAEHILRRMRYVSFEEFEKWLQSSVSQLLADIQRQTGKKEAIAIFPVMKPFIHYYNADKEAKPPNDSAGRIAHSLRNLERDLPKHVELTPRIDSMRARRVRHIIFVDDFVGTGDRFIESWTSLVHRSIKAWCSMGWCKVWLIVFAGHAVGLNRIIHKIGPVVKERMRAHLIVKKSFIEENANLISVLKKYGVRVGKKDGAFGYGGLLSPVVFQYGCPNNVTELLWKMGIGPKQTRWHPLFTNRSISSDLYPMFQIDLSLESTPEELWMAKQYQLGIRVLERLENFRGNHELLLLLALIGQGKTLDKIRNVMVLAQDEFDSLVKESMVAGLLDDKGNLSRFGQDILKRGSKRHRIQILREGRGGNFYPATFMGFQREA